MNALIIEQFNQLVKQIEAEYLNAQVENNVKEMKSHEFRLRSIKKSLSIIRKLDFEITDPNDISNIPGIGKGTIQRVREILETGKLSELQNKYDNAKQQKINDIQELEKVIGIGSTTAKKLVIKQDIHNIKQLKSAVKSGKVKVNPLIKLGLKYYGIVEGNIPRKEIKITEKYLLEQARQINPELSVVVCGSYRRGKAFSGDIDLLMYHPSIKTTKGIINPKQYGFNAYLNLFVKKLEENGFMLDHMTDKNYNMKYMGFSQYKSYPVRRIDIRFVPYNSLPTAMLYYTGPYELNEMMRRTAKKKGMFLNEYGLYRVTDDGRQLLKVKTEKDIFDLLGIEYLTPEERETFSIGRTKKTKV